MEARDIYNLDIHLCKSADCKSLISEVLGVASEYIHFLYSDRLIASWASSLPPTHLYCSVAIPYLGR